MAILYQKLLQLLQEEEESINTIVSTIPTSLDANDLLVQKVGDYFLPFSTGFEIECNKGEDFNDQNFKNIPNIIEVLCDTSEQRFRIPNGILGLQCLYNISIQLKKNSLLNPLSGIHYHIDFTDAYEYLTSDMIEFNKSWMLEELDEWNYVSFYNSRNINFNTCHNWVRFQGIFKTLEFRIGEMTFDYSLLFKRIVHANFIVQEFKEKIITDYLFKNNSDFMYSKDNITTMLKNRIKKI